eukprot:s5085_g1.t1
MPWRRLVVSKRLARLQLYRSLLSGRLRRDRKPARSNDAAGLRQLLRRAAPQLVTGDAPHQEVILRLGKAMRAEAAMNWLPPLSNGEIATRLEKSLRHDRECRRGRVRVVRLRSSEDLFFV